MMLWSWETGQPRLWSLRSKSYDKNSHGLLEYHSVGGVRSATQLIGGSGVTSRPEPWLSADHRRLPHGGNCQRVAWMALHCYMAGVPGPL